MFIKGEFVWIYLTILKKGELIMKYKMMIAKAIGIIISLCLISITSISALAAEEKNVNITIAEIENIKENSFIIQENDRKHR